MSEQKLCYTIGEFAKLQGVSRAQLYQLIGRGEGPATYQVGNRRRISIEAPGGGTPGTGKARGQ
jgi:excisionase family DNA binding protein